MSSREDSGKPASGRSFLENSRLRGAAGMLASSPHVVLALILLLAFLVYAPVLNDWFKADDFLYLRAAQVKAPSEFIIEAFDFRDTTEPAAGPGGHYRPLYVITILAEAELFGSSALPYHLLNLMVHVASVAMLWLIARKATQRPLVAHIAALVFALHPTYAMTLGWISELSALAATLGALVCLWSFMKALDEGARSKLWYLVSLASYLAAMLYHPKAAPVLVALAAYFFFVHGGTRRESLAFRSWLRFIPYLGIALFPVLVSLYLREEYLRLQFNFSYGPHLYENFLHYLFMGVVPYPLLAGTKVFGTVAPTFTGGIIAFSAWLGIAIWPLKDSRKRAAHLFALVWFLTALLPLLTFRFGASPRQFYIAGPALALVLSLFLVSALDSLSRLRFPRFAGVAVLLVLLVLASQRIFITVQDQGLPSAQSRDFIEELRQTYPTLPEKATLYVVGAPLALRIFGDVYLVNAVQTYYGDIRVEPVSQTQALELEQFPQPNERVFRYSGYD